MQPLLELLPPASKLEGPTEYTEYIYFNRLISLPGLRHAHLSHAPLYAPILYLLTLDLCSTGSLVLPSRGTQLQSYYVKPPIFTSACHVKSRHV